MSELLVFITPVIGLLGVLVGQVFVRGRELRESRRAAYVGWVKASGSLLMLDDEPPAGTNVTVPTLDRAQALNESTYELLVVGSRKVGLATGKYMKVLPSKLPKTKSNIRDLVEVANKAMAAERREVINEMRHDLLPWWRWWERPLTTLPPMLVGQDDSG